MKSTSPRCSIWRLCCSYHLHHHHPGKAGKQSINLKLPIGEQAECQAPGCRPCGRSGRWGVPTSRGTGGTNRKLEAALLAEYRKIRTCVALRADREGPNKYPVSIIEACQRNGITWFTFDDRTGALRPCTTMDRTLQRCLGSTAPTPPCCCSFCCSAVLRPERSSEPRCAGVADHPHGPAADHG